MNTSIFKSYDIRGIYPSEFNEEAALAIGRATVQKLNAKAVVIGRDNRASSKTISDAFARGVTLEGADVIDIGLVSTPMLYFASATLPVDGAAVITASHNPGQYNGLKICAKYAIPFGLASGLGDIRDIAARGNFKDDKPIGKISTYTITEEYQKYFTSFADFSGKKFRIATDTAHAMGVLELPILEKLPGISFVGKLFETLAPPGTCPHEANPLKTDTLDELAAMVKRNGADIGIAFDGDADRIGFIDELGRPLPMDLVTAIIAPEVLRRHPRSTVLYDLRSSQSVKEEIEKADGVAHECMVGHANIKGQMRREHAAFAGELSGHYYFTEMGYSAEMGTLPAILLLNIMSRTGKKLSELVDGVRRYAHSGEINFEVKNAGEIFACVKQKYADGLLGEIDGIKISYNDWWFSLRASNTEPLMRLNLEARSPTLMEEKKKDIVALIHQA